MQFLQKTHNKTHHFVAFFSIFRLFFLFSLFSLSFCNSFCHFFDFFKTPTLDFSSESKVPKIPKYPKTQLYTQKYIFLVKLFSSFTLFSPFVGVFSTPAPIFSSKVNPLEMTNPRLPASPRRTQRTCLYLPFSAVQSPPADVH